MEESFIGEETFTGGGTVFSSIIKKKTIKK